MGAVFLGCGPPMRPNVPSHFSVTQLPLYTQHPKLPSQSSNQTLPLSFTHPCEKPGSGVA